MSGAAPEPLDGGSSSSGVRWSVGREGVAEIFLDSPGEKVNVINPSVLTAVAEALAYFMRRGDVLGLVVASAKPGAFIAGADVRLIAEVRTIEEGRGKSLNGQVVFQALAAAPFPSVAAISGACLGGGLELALACTARVAADAEEVQIGLPEVRLGIIPGWGGTQRLPRLIGLPAALKLILTGRTLSAREALKLGVVDGIAAPERLRSEAGLLVSRIRAASPAGPPAGWRLPSRRPLRGAQRLLLRAPLRNLILSRAAASARKSTGGRYPAPLAAVDAVGWGLARGIEEGMSREADLVGGLVTGEVSRNLVRIFLASRGAESDPISPIPRPEIRSIGVLGAGVMGGAIAAVAAGKGIPVRLRDVASAPLARGLSEAHAILAGRGARRRPEAWTLSRFLKIAPTTGLEGFSGADLVLEAVVEDLEVKRNVLSEIEKRVRDDCVLATNTSSLSVAAIASGLRLPSRFVGLHFFNPADRMPLVEIVKGPMSGPASVAAARDLAKRMGKTPIVVADAPGFVVNRLLMPYLAEALRRVAGGHDVEEIDRALVRFGMPMGPLALLDQIGLDVAAKVSKVLSTHFGDHLPGDGSLEALAQAGWLGAKGGVGFYLYSGGKKTAANPKAAALVREVSRHASGGPPAEPGRPGAPDRLRGSMENRQRHTLAERLLYPLINEAARLLEEGVVDNPQTIDVAMVFGTGFPPFLGGPLRWADRQGLPEVAAALRAMSERDGAHLAPSGRLARMADGGGRFFPA